MSLISGPRAVRRIFVSKHKSVSSYFALIHKHLSNMFSFQSRETDFCCKAKISLKLFCIDLQAFEQHFQPWEPWDGFLPQSKNPSQAILHCISMHFNNIFSPWSHKTNSCFEQRQIAAERRQNAAERRQYAAEQYVVLNAPKMPQDFSRSYQEDSAQAHFLL